ncbi:MAG: hypothetical protein ACYS1A_19650, partial [Planctomycetota bacterium]
MNRRSFFKSVLGVAVGIPLCIREWWKPKKPEGLTEEKLLEAVKMFEEETPCWNLDNTPAGYVLYYDKEGYALDADGHYYIWAGGKWEEATTGPTWSGEHYAYYVTHTNCEKNVGYGPVELG